MMEVYIGFSSYMREEPLNRLERGGERYRTWVMAFWGHDARAESLGASSSQLVEKKRCKFSESR